MVLDSAYQMKSPLLSPALARVTGDGQPPRIIGEGSGSRRSVSAASNWLPLGSPNVTYAPTIKSSRSAVPATACHAPCRLVTLRLDLEL
jgi:hypothetical protein